MLPFHDYCCDINNRLERSVVLAMNTNTNIKPPSEMTGVFQLWRLLLIRHEERRIDPENPAVHGDAFFADHAIFKDGRALHPHRVIALRLHEHDGHREHDERIFRRHIPSPPRFRHRPRRLDRSERLETRGSG